MYNLLNVSWVIDPLKFIEFSDRIYIPFIYSDNYEYFVLEIIKICCKYNEFDIQKPTQSFIYLIDRIWRLNSMIMICDFLFSREIRYPIKYMIDNDLDFYIFEMPNTATNAIVRVNFLYSTNELHKYVVNFTLADMIKFVWRADIMLSFYILKSEGLLDILDLDVQVLLLWKKLQERFDIMKEYWFSISDIRNFLKTSYLIKNSKQTDSQGELREWLDIFANFTRKQFLKKIEELSLL